MAEALEQRTFGSTGERVSVIGLGGGYLDNFSLSEGVYTVHRALDLGVTYFDTSPDYLCGSSQMILSNALKDRKESYFLATKLGYHLPSVEMHRSKEILNYQFKETLRILRRKQVDLIQIHEADHASWWMDSVTDRESFDDHRAVDLTSAPAMQVLLEAKQSGLCRYIGITGNRPNALGNILPRVPVDSCLSAYAHNLIFRHGKNFLGNLAHLYKKAYIVGGVFSSGLATVNRDWIENPPKWMKPCQHARLPRLYELQKESGISLTHLGIRYLLADPKISVILVGASTGIELEDAINAAREGLLPPDLHQALEELGVDESQYE